jgi:hydroxyacylglutathione hydrolase
MIQIKIFTVNPFQENTYLLYNENNNAILIDAGFSTAEEEKKLLYFLEKNKITIVKYIQTHCHIDHVLGNNFVNKSFGLKAQAHVLESEVLYSATSVAQLYGINYIKCAGIESYINHKQIVMLDNDLLQAIHVPGHSPGSLVFYCKAQSFAIGGDVLFYGSIGRTDLPGGNHDELIQRIKSELFVLPNETIVYPGHGNSTTIGYEKLNNPFF